MVARDVCRLSPPDAHRFAGGIGITPFLSYLETIASQAEPPAVWLYYANRNLSSQAFAQRIAELKTHLPTLQVFNACDDPDVKGGDIIGRLTADVVDDSLVHRRARFYFCGPEPMMNGITAQLLARGVPSFDIFREAFKSPAKPTGDPDQTFQVTFSRSQKAIVWSPDKGSLLAFAERNGISLPSGCRVGQYPELDQAAGCWVCKQKHSRSWAHGSVVINGCGTRNQH
ncbi:hypothetical protein J1C56_15655 [Aminobacter anthyllidis]|uniref:Oxidoreductase FAD/NAD(P)-binding domain-containing protein n=1 Tax=Aminobacter anthyllidis TaxID=1035067 RepID=A0A9X1AC28_9HYPH|nr:hypothetical protein [Aminobacter anthyllidis]MBT1157034.1 hypothetical protein [Aminobacter anthyllidis]